MDSREPNLTGRPLQLVVERSMSVSPAALFAAWTEGFDRVVCRAGSVLMRPAVDEPFYFETEHEANGNPIRAVPGPGAGSTYPSRTLPEPRGRREPKRPSP